MNVGVSLLNLLSKIRDSTTYMRNTYCYWQGLGLTAALEFFFANFLIELQGPIRNDRYTYSTYVCSTYIPPDDKYILH